MSEHSKKFPKQTMQDLACGNETPGLRVILKHVVDSSRWSIEEEMIFREDSQPEGEGYRSYFSRGATESQDERPYEYAGEEVECQRVRLVEKSVKVWQDTETNSQMTLAKQ